MRFIQDPETLELVPADQFVPRETHHYVMGDIDPYVSMIDGRLITSRSKHRVHLRDHGKIEVGNEVEYLKNQVKPMAPPPGLKRHLIEAFNQKVRS